MNINRKYSIVPLLAAIILSLMTPTLSSQVQGTETPEAPPPPKSLILVKAKGIALDANETLLRAHLALVCGLYEPITKDGLTIIPIAIFKGFIKIGDVTYNITQGKGMIIQERHRIVLKGAGIGSNEENVLFFLSGKWIVVDGVYVLWLLRGIITIDDTKMLALFKGYPTPLRPMWQ